MNNKQFDDVIEVIYQISNTTKRTEKEKILHSVKNTDCEDTFKEVCFRAYDPNEVYNINSTDWITPIPQDSHTSINEIFNYFDCMKRGELSGNQAKDVINTTLGGLNEKQVDLVKRIIKGDLRCGISAKTINKVFPNLIYVHPYHGCVTFNEKNLSNIQFPCFSQTKEDGLYIDIVVYDDRVEYMTRNGRVVNFNSSIDDVLIEHSNGYVLQGEALSLNDDGTVMNREDGNGYLNSNYFDPERVIFVVWNIVSVEEFHEHKGENNYSDTYELIKECVTLTNSPRLRIVDTRICHNTDDVIQHFKENVKNGLEGTIIKNYNTVWKSGRDRNMVKVKIAFEVELKVVGIKEGTGKYSGMVGSLACETKEGKLQVSVGSGFKDAQRKLTDLEGSIVTVKSNDIINNDNNPEVKSLFLPIFNGIRTDKNEPDTIEKVYEQRDAAINALSKIV